MLAWSIALRYLFSKKSHGAVNIISVISVIGVAVATMAITIVLSVFNGFSRMASDHLSVLDPQLKITPVTGKVITDGDSLAQVVASLPFVRDAIPVIEERGLVIYGNQQMPVYFKGVPQHYERFAHIDSVMVEGEYTDYADGAATASLSSGVAMKTGARATYGNVISLYVPRRMGRINPANPAAAFSGVDLVVSGVFQIGQVQYDMEHMFIPLAEARELLQYTTEATAVDVALRDGIGISSAAQTLRTALGDRYKVSTQLQLQEDSFRMIQIEKWVTFLMLAFILVIASFNIISTLSLLVIEKRSNMATLRALGAPARLIRRIFIIQGWLISVLGGITGIALGTILALCQQHFGWIKLGGDPTHLIITVYPVHVEVSDLAIVLALVVVVGFLTSQVTRIFTKESF